MHAVALSAAAAGLNWLRFGCTFDEDATETVKNLKSYRKPHSLELFQSFGQELYGHVMCQRSLDRRKMFGRLSIIFLFFFLVSYLGHNLYGVFEFLPFDDGA